MHRPKGLIVYDNDMLWSKSIKDLRYVCEYSIIPVKGIILILK